MRRKTQLWLVNTVNARERQKVLANNANIVFPNPVILIATSINDLQVWNYRGAMLDEKGVGVKQVRCGFDRYVMVDPINLVTFAIP